MTTAGTILEAAWNRSAANDAGKLAQDPELLAHLSRVYQRAWALIARARPDQFTSRVTLALAGVPAAVTLPLDVVDVVGVWTATGAPVTVAPTTERHRSWHLAPCVVREGRLLVSRGGPGDPVVGQRLAVALLDAPAALGARTSVLDPRWPARHEQLLVDLVAQYLGTKDAGRPPAEVAKLADEAKASAAALAAEYGLAPSAISWMHAPVERAGREQPS